MTVAGSVDCRILCEYHEDWVALRNGNAELVSAKHPGRAFGAYTTLNSLADDGGVGHLFNRWLALAEKPTCRLVTTAGASGHAQKLIELAEAARGWRIAGEEFTPDENQDDIVKNFGKALLKHCAGLPDRWTSSDGTPLESPNAEHRHQITRFLSVFTFQPSVPREYAPHAAPSMFVQPVLDRLRTTAPAGSVWEAVLGLFRARMRAVCRRTGEHAQLRTPERAQSAAPARSASYLQSIDARHPLVAAVTAG